MCFDRIDKKLEDAYDETLAVDIFVRAAALRYIPSLGHNLNLRASHFLG